MMGLFERKTSIVGFVLLVVALALSIIASISVPHLHAIDVARVAYTVDGINTGENEIRFGIWGACAKTKAAGTICQNPGRGYTAALLSFDSDPVVIIGPSWTRGLAVTPVAAGVTLVALVLFFLPYAIAYAAALGVATFLMLLAFVIDIAFLAKVRAQDFHTGGIRADTSAGVGFWLTFVSFILLCFVGCSACIGHRRANGKDIELGRIFRR